METTTEKPVITIETTVTAAIERVWECWNEPKHITKWCYASDDWHAPYAENDLRPGGKFKTRMEAKDGSFGFEFEGTYNEVEKYEKIAYEIADGRKVSVTFSGERDGVRVVERFEAESTHPIEMQRGGWQAILDNFKKYAEAQ